MVPTQLLHGTYTLVPPKAVGEQYLIFVIHLLTHIEKKYVILGGGTNSNYLGLSS
jgi:hypothetical protein